MDPYVQTVTGPIPAASLGFTLPHEHAGLPVSTRPGGDPWEMWDLTNDEELTAEELLRYKAAGGTCLVDLTCNGLGRDPEILRRLSTRTGVPIVMGCGWYRGAVNAAEWRIERRSASDLADELVTEFRDGVGTTGIKPGIIGEIGTDTSVVNAAEERVFRACARASIATGMAISTHAMRPRVGLAELDILLDEGVDPSRIVVGHVDLCPHLDYYIAMLEQGANIEFDFLGQMSARWKNAMRRVQEGTEPRVISILIELLKRGFAGQILLSHDEGIAYNLGMTGGHGYIYVLEYFLPRLRERGVDEEAIHQMTVLNPRRILSLT